MRCAQELAQNCMQHRLSARTGFTADFFPFYAQISNAEDTSGDISFSGGSHASVVVFPARFFPRAVEIEVDSETAVAPQLPAPAEGSALRRDRLLADEVLNRHCCCL